jgi:hypothetical protein
VENGVDVGVWWVVIGLSAPALGMGMLVRASGAVGSRFYNQGLGMLSRRADMTTISATIAHVVSRSPN